MRYWMLAALGLIAGCSFGASETTVIVTVPVAPTTSTIPVTAPTTTTTTPPATVASEGTLTDWQLVDASGFLMIIPQDWKLTELTQEQLQSTVDSSGVSFGDVDISTDDVDKFRLAATETDAEGFAANVSVTATASPEGLETFTVDAISVLEDAGGVISGATTVETSQGLAVIIVVEFDTIGSGRIYIRSMHVSDGETLYTITVSSDDPTETELLATRMLESVDF